MVGGELAFEIRVLAKHGKGVREIAREVGVSRNAGSAGGARRLLAIAAALEGLSREAAARLAGMDRQRLRDWVIRYNRDGLAGLSDDWGDGRPCRLTAGQQATLKAIVLQGPDPEVDGVSTWRLIDLCQIVQERFGVTYSETGMGKLMRSLDLSWQTPRPRHAESADSAEVGR